MTPILYANKPNPGAVATSGLYAVDVCECCTHPYNPLPFQKLQIKETYGMAILNEGQAIKVVREAHKHS